METSPPCTDETCPSAGTTHWHAGALVAVELTDMGAGLRDEPVGFVVAPFVVEVPKPAFKGGVVTATRKPWTRQATPYEDLAMQLREDAVSAPTEAARRRLHAAADALDGSFVGKLHSLLRDAHRKTGYRIEATIRVMNASDLDALTVAESLGAPMTSYSNGNSRGQVHATAPGIAFVAVPNITTRVLDQAPTDRLDDALVNLATSLGIEELTAHRLPEMHAVEYGARRGVHVRTVRVTDQMLASQYDGIGAAIQELGRQLAEALHHGEAVHQAT